MAQRPRPRPPFAKSGSPLPQNRDLPKTAEFRAPVRSVFEMFPAIARSRQDRHNAAHVAMRCDSAGGAQRIAFFEFLPDFRDRAGRFEGATKRFYPTSTKRFQLFAALRDQFVFRLHAVGMIMVERACAKCLF